MTFTNPMYPTDDDNSPAAVLERTRQAYTDTGKRIEALTAERVRLIAEHNAANNDYRLRTAELGRELQAARIDHANWGRMLPHGDTARGNGAQ